MAVEFMDHAAAAFVARENGWFEEAGLTISAYEAYTTGMALAAALARNDIQIAYMCLVPAINVYANANVPISIVAGTHKYGYGLVVDPRRVATVADLQRAQIRVGCVREGGAVDVVMLHKTIDTYHLDKRKILCSVRRMNPAKQIMALRSGQLDAAFLPEQWATMAEEMGFRMLLTSRDVWPGIQGSVLAIKRDLLREHPDIAHKLVIITRRATAWINKHPEEAAAIVAQHLSAFARNGSAAKGSGLHHDWTITPQTIAQSMTRMTLTTYIDMAVVQEVIDYMAHLGYIKKRLPAHHIVDTRYADAS
jgi:NitT/TauT family transport system substrate-binding protein